MGSSLSFEEQDRENLRSDPSDGGLLAPWAYDAADEDCRAEMIRRGRADDEQMERTWTFIADT